MSSINKPKPHYFVIKNSRTNIRNGEKYKISLITTNTNGKTYKYKRSISNEHAFDAMDYFKQKMKTNGELKDAPAGIYTWIIVGDDFYATKVISKQEIGTMHRDLYRFSDSRSHNESDIIAAGELEIQEDRKVEFNFLSGTYFTKFIPVKIVKEGGKEEFMEKLAEKVGSKIASLGFDTVEYIQSRAIINAANIRASPNNIHKLNAFFIREGGKRLTKRNKTKKRYVKK